MKTHAVTPIPSTDDDAGAVAAHCFHLAGQMTRGPVRDALLAMARDHATRARTIAQTAGFRFELARSERPTRLARLFAFLTDLTAPLPRAPARPVAAAVMPAPQRAQRTRVTPTPVGKRERAPRSSRLFRMHALTRPDG